VRFLLAGPVRRSDIQLRTRIARTLPNRYSVSIRIEKAMVKPHGRLVLVSSTSFNASTSSLSTSLSRTGL
jgi:hypothetical protein